MLLSVRKRISLKSFECISVSYCCCRLICCLFTTLCFDPFWAKWKKKDVVDTNEHIVFSIPIILTCSKTAIVECECVDYLYVVHLACFPGFIHIKRTQLNARFVPEYVWLSGFQQKSTHFHMGKRWRELTTFKKERERETLPLSRQMARRWRWHGNQNTKRKFETTESSKINYRLCTASFVIFCVPILLSCCKIAS